jgi:LmbE family N-acetylglucosaminyl deacetylase
VASRPSLVSIHPDHKRRFEMTIAATLRAVAEVRRPFGHRVPALPTEHEATNDRLAPTLVPPDLPSGRTPDVELLAHSYLRLLGH